VAEAKAEILEGLKPDGTAVLNADDPWSKTLADRAPGRVITFGFSQDAEVRASGMAYAGYDGLQFRLHYDGAAREVTLPFLTGGQVENFLAALGVAAAFGLGWETLKPALAVLAPAAKRGNIIRLARGITVIDDTYNSNPRALDMALRSYINLPAGRWVAVLGDMLELGPEGDQYHEDAGRTAGRLGWDIVAAVGPAARRIAAGARAEGLDAARAPEFASSEEAAAKLPAMLKADDLVLVKGSRGVRMERIIERLTALMKEN